MNHDVFISYSRKDTETADRICAAFDKAGISYFIDRKGIAGGMEFPLVLADAIEQSQLFLFLASENSYQSKFTNNEVLFAFNEKPHNTLLPYIIDGTRMPASLRFTFASINVRNIKEHPIEPVLVDDVLRLLDREEEDSVHRQAAQEAAARQTAMEAERKAKEEAQRKAKQEAERKAKEEAERKAKEEAERKAKEEAERKAKEEAERKAKAEVKAEAERKAKAESERKAKVEYTLVGKGETVLESEFLFKNLENVKVASGVLEIGKEAFSYCERIKRVRLNSDLKIIRKGAFHGCKSLEEINIPKGVHTIEKQAFYGCIGLTKVVIPESVVTIGGGFVSGAFVDCKNLKTLILNEGLEEIQRDAFNGCVSLEKVTIPSTVKNIAKDAFSGCENLKTVVLKSRKTQYSTGFFTPSFPAGANIIIKEQ